MRTSSVATALVLLASVSAAQGKPGKRPKAVDEPPAATPVAPAPTPPPPEPAPVVTEPTTAVAPSAPKPQLKADEKPKLAVVRLEPQGVSPQEAGALTDTLVAALTARGLFTIVSSKDIETAVGAERQRQLMGVCEAQPESCGTAFQDLAVTFVLSGQLSRVGAAYQLTLQAVDTTKGRALGRSNRLASSLEDLHTLMPYAAAEATGSPLPPPPSRVLPVTLLISGGATFFAGAIAGLITLTQQGQLNDELCPGGVPPDGRCTGEGLRERAFYVAQDDVLTRQKWVAAGLLLGGAALTILGVVLMPPAETSGRFSATVVPTLSGLALTGGFW